MSDRLEIPDEAKQAACAAYEYALLVDPSGDRGNLDAHEEVRALLAAAPLIVAAELERLAGEMDTRPKAYSITSEDVRARAAELRGTPNADT